MFGFLSEIRDNITDTFYNLPLVMLGFLFLLAILTSNVGLIYLLIGHSTLVPALSFLSDPSSNPFVGGDTNIMTFIKTFFAQLFILTVQARALGGGTRYLMLLLSLLPFLGQVFGGNKSAMFFFNPIGWMRSAEVDDESPELLGKKPGTCGMLPGGIPRENPSTWVSHMAFFYGFLMANSDALLKQPAPQLYNVKKNTKEYNERKEKIRLRVQHRKRRVLMVITISTILFLMLFIGRYLLSKCEGNFFYNIIPVVITSLTGAAWFRILYKDCGIQPADILGIVQGMISPRMSDNPVVCVGA